MLPVHSHCRLAGLALLMSALLSTALHAQTADAAKSAPALSDAERAKRDGDKVSQWIRLVADKAAAKAAPAPAPAAKKANPQPSPAPSNNGATLAAARKQVEALTESSVAAAAPAVVEPTPAPAPVSPDPGTRIALAAPVAPVQTAPPPPVAEEPEVPLKALFQVQPEFPRQLVNTLQTGMVAVRFTVRPDGTVSQAEAVSSSHRRLSQAAIDAVKQWRFAPIKQERTASVEVGFKLE
ncbi:MAG: energy transducer TonB [Burkholderiaceae bacterium]|nr:energy transducer TonB [Burkholderiaceae bacterium]